MDLIKIFEITVQYLEKSGMDTLIVVCLSLVLVATTIWVIAWIADHKSIKNLLKSISDIANFSKKRFEKANNSPFDNAVKNSKIFLAIEFMYLYFMALILLIYGLGTLYIGASVEANSILGKFTIFVFGFLIVIFARFAKVAADKSYFKYKNGHDWDDET